MLKWLVISLVKKASYSLVQNFELKYQLSSQLKISSHSIWILQWFRTQYRYCLDNTRAGRIRFSGARKSVLLKASSGERCAPRNFVHLVILRDTRVPLILYLVVYLVTKCTNILQFPHVMAEWLSEKKKPRLCFPR